MNKAFGKWMVVVALVGSTAAWARPMSLSVGETKFLGYSGKFTKVRVSNPAVVSVHMEKGSAEFRGRVAGVSRVRLWTRSGERFAFDVHVTRGAEVYSLDRSEPEHGEFSLSTAAAPRKKAEVARKAARAAAKLRAARSGGKGQPRA